jgi:hypothetical protein
VNELLNRLIANDFADLDGLQVTGTLPVREELLNEVLAELLRQGQQGQAAPATGAAPSAATETTAAAAPNIDPKTLLRFVKNARVSAQDGRLTLHFDVRVDGAAAKG